MNVRRSIGCAFLAAAVMAAPASGATPRVRTLDNGLTVAVFPDARLPIVQIQVLVPGGTANETDREHGAAQVVARLLVRGTTSRSAADFFSEVEGLGGTLSAGAALEYATLSGAFRAVDLGAGLELVADAVMNPLLDEDEIRRARGDLFQDLLQSRRVSGLLADEHVWARVMHGHPYGVPQLGDFESVAGLGHAELQRFHRECYRPDRALLAISGRVDPDSAFAAAAETFGAWKGRARATPPPPPRPEAFAIRLVDVPGATEAEIRLGMAGPAQNSPDACALIVANDLLGGGPGSRLSPSTGGRVVKSRSALNMLEDGGLVVLGTVARNDSVVAAVSRLRAELKRFVQQPPSDAEVAASGRAIGRAFPVLNEATSSQASQWLGARFYGLGDDYADRYPQRIEAVNGAAVKEAAGRWFDADHAELVVLGSAAALRAKLEALGTVEVVPLSAPAAEVATAPARRMTPPSAAEIARGRELADQAVVAHGGLAKLRNIKDSTVESEMTLYGQDKTVTARQKEMRRDPLQLRVETTFQNMGSVQGLDGSKGWLRVMANGDSILDEDSLGVARLRGSFRSDPVHVLLTAADPKTRAAWRGEEEIAARPVDVVEIVSETGDRQVLFLDRATRRLAAIEENAGSAFAGPSLRRIYGELRLVQGIVWPYYEERLLDGQRTLTFKTSLAQFNTGLAAEAFARPVKAPAGARGLPRGR